jgi:hypothetical protein
MTDAGPRDPGPSADDVRGAVGPAPSHRPGWTIDPEPASVTASRQLAADSRDRRRRVSVVAGEPRGTTRRIRQTPARAAIRPLGRSGAEHLDGAGAVDDGAAAERRLGRDPRAEDAGRDERRRSSGTATGGASA